jgi:poly(hydroxyalkanoate) depolymerase family esterase
LYFSTFSRSIKRNLKSLTRLAVRASKKAAKATKLTKATQLALSPPKRITKKTAVRKARTASSTKMQTGFAAGLAHGLRYRLFVPMGVQRSERLPLLVMLHGCGQSAQELAASTRMNQIAARERFLVLYPEQDRLSNMQGCWNWFQTRTGKAQDEADAILMAVDQVVRTHPVDVRRVALAGLSAGAGMAALLATRQPQRFRAVAMHSGIAPGLAHSTASALSAMRGHSSALAVASPAGGAALPALLVIQGQADAVVAPANGGRAAQLWAHHEGAKAGQARRVQRGDRYAATLTDFFTAGRLVTTLCEIDKLGHAWSGGTTTQAYSDARGPDASRMIWAFASKQFSKGQPAALAQLAG